MRRIWFAFPLAVVLASPAAAQRYIGAGSTAQGDYLRGVGVAANGMGLYNLNTAMAESIHADTEIKVDTYLSMVFKHARDRWAEIDRRREEKSKANYRVILDRIQNNPESLDVFTGNALNAAMKDLNNPAIQESSFRSAPVPVPREMLRRIPFKMDEKGLVFSIQRLTARGKGKWPVAFQQDNYEPERRAYDKAIDQAMGEMIDGKVTREAIAAYNAAVHALSAKLQEEYGVKLGLRYTEAKSRITEMEKAARMLETQKMQPVMAELDRYTGTTVNDLRLFMLAHNLRFAPADGNDERKLYIELYASIHTVRRMMDIQQKGADQ